MNDRGTGPPTDAERSVVTIGTYDGVHLGHRRLIAETMRAARERRVKSVAVTFNVHPLSVLRPEAPLRLLCTQEEKISLLQSTGVDEVVVLTFDRARARESAEDFVVEELVERLRATQVVVGSNFRFGFGRRGDVPLLHAMGARLGFSTQGIELVLDDEHHSVVSSSRIRDLIGAGELVEAGRLLGRTYTLAGSVNERGELILAEGLLVPVAGSYAIEILPAGPPSADLSSTGPSAAGSALAAAGRVEISATGQITLAGMPHAHREGQITLGFPRDREPVATAHR